jgi:hypothetical protein
MARPVSLQYIARELDLVHDVAETKTDRAHQSLEVVKIVDRGEVPKVTLQVGLRVTGEQLVAIGIEGAFRIEQRGHRVTATPCKVLPRLGSTVRGVQAVEPGSNGHLEEHVPITRCHLAKLLPSRQRPERDIARAGATL